MCIAENARDTGDMRHRECSRYIECTRYIRYGECTRYTECIRYGEIIKLKNEQYVVWHAMLQVKLSLSRYSLHELTTQELE